MFVVNSEIRCSHCGEEIVVRTWNPFKAIAAFIRFERIAKDGGQIKHDDCGGNTLVVPFYQWSAPISGVVLNKANFHRLQDELVSEIKEL